jgi:phytoene desaturase
MLYLGLKRQYPELLHHNVVFGRDYKGSFDAIFERFQVPEDPSFYVNVPSRTDPSLAPPGKEAVYVLVPVPHQHPGLDWKVEGPKVRAKVFQRLAELGFPHLEADTEVERVFTPDDWASTFNLARGSAFGLAQNFRQIGPFRPANQDARVKNLFFVGASTQPGTGLPTVLISARLVTERMVAWARAAGLSLSPRGAPAPALEVAA